MPSLSLWVCPVLQTDPHSTVPQSMSGSIPHQGPQSSKVFPEHQTRSLATGLSEPPDLATYSLKSE